MTQRDETHQGNEIHSLIGVILRCDEIKRLERGSIKAHVLRNEKICIFYLNNEHEKHKHRDDEYIFVLIFILNKNSFRTRNHLFEIEFLHAPRAK